MRIHEKDFEGFISGNERSLEIIFRQYFKTLVAFSMRFGLEQMEAEDVVIETVHRIWEIRSDVKSPAALNALFYTSVRNRALNVVRNIKNRESLLAAQELESDAFFHDNLVEEEVSRILSEAIEALPKQCKRVVTMMMSGSTTADIAEQMNLSVSSVKTYKSRAIEMLKVSLSEYPLLLFYILLKFSEF